MIENLIDYIKLYLLGDKIVTPKGYREISINNKDMMKDYYFYYFLEDYIGEEGLYLTGNDDIDSIVEDIHSLAIEMEPLLDTTDMDRRLKALYDKLVKKNKK